MRNRVTFHIDNNWSYAIKETPGNFSMVEFNTNTFLKFCKIVCEKNG